MLLNGFLNGSSLRPDLAAAFCVQRDKQHMLAVSLSEAVGDDDGADCRK